MTALALAAPAGPGVDVRARLEALTDKEFLAAAGWDPLTMVLSPSSEHPTLGWPVCRVGACDAMAETAAGLCVGCTKRMVRDGTADPPGVSAETWRIDVGRCVVGCPRPWESTRRPLCAAHDHQQRVVLDVPVEVFLSRADVVPLAGFGQCTVLACTRLRHSRLSPLCKAHHRRWSDAVGRDRQLSQPQWCRTESAVAEGGEISMRGLPPAVVAELLYGLQQRCAEGVKTHRAILRPLCDELRRTQVASINDLPPPTRRQRRHLLRSLVTHCRRGLSSPAAEQAKDVWDLVVFGHRGTLDFTSLSQRWLRHATQRWVAEDLPRRRSANAANV